MLNESDERDKIYNKIKDDKQWLKTLLVEILIEQKKINSFFVSSKKEDECREIEAKSQMKQLEKLLPAEFKNMFGPILNMK